MGLNPSVCSGHGPFAPAGWPWLTLPQSPARLQVCFCSIRSHDCFGPVFLFLVAAPGSQAVSTFCVANLVNRGAYPLRFCFF